MRKLRYILLYLMVFSLGLPAPLTAANSEDVQGSYCLLSKTKFKAKGLGAIVGTDDCYDELTLNIDGTFSLGSPTDPVTGTFDFDSKGKKILLELDQSGQEGLKDIFAQLISDLVWEKEGVSISPDEIDIEFQPIKAFKIKIDKKTEKPKGSFKVKIKGIASAMVDDQPEQGKFSFGGKFTIKDDGITPAAGEWGGPADFGYLGFTVDSTSTGITEITWDWIDFTCGIVTLNGSITSTYVSPKAINKGQFPTVELSPFVSGDDDSSFSMSGTFDATGTNASGTYEAFVYGTTCQGAWSASPGGSTTTIDWVGTPRVEHNGLAKKFYQSFVVSGPSGNVPITATCKNSSGSILDAVTQDFPVETGKEYEITVDATVLGLGRSPSPDSDEVFFNSSSAPFSTWISIGDCTATYDDVLMEWYYLCATDYSITDINIQLVP